MERDTGDKMDNPEPKLERGPEVHFYHYPPAVPCPDCRGSGRVVLLVSARPCGTCEGAGKVWPEPRHEHTPAKLGYWRRKQQFDELGRMISQCLWFEPEPASRETRNPK
jgi:hypothetical protein